MFVSKLRVLTHVLVIASGVGVGLATAGKTAEWSSLGVPISKEEIAKVDISITPDGVGLPTGSGSVSHGKAIYDAQCAACHGDSGASGDDLADPLVGGLGTLASEAPAKTVGSFWPYASTLFDYTRRAMPLNAPLSLSDDEVYAVTAYLLFLNEIVAEDTVLDQKTLNDVKMPNRNGFKSNWPGYEH